MGREGRVLFRPEGGMMLLFSNSLILHERRGFDKSFCMTADNDFF